MRRPLVSYCALAATSGAFLAELLTGSLGSDAALVKLGALPGTGRIGIEVWRLVSYAFLHASWAHFVLNAALLAWLGPLLERRLGSLSTASLLLASSVACGLGILLNHRLHPSADASLGMSGVLFAFLGASLVLLDRESGTRAPRLALWAVLVAGVASSFVGGVSLVGHLVGLAVGVAWALVFVLRRSVRSAEG